MTPRGGATPGMWDASSAPWYEQREHRGHWGSACPPPSLLDGFCRPLGQWQRWRQRGAGGQVERGFRPPREPFPVGRQRGHPEEVGTGQLQPCPVRAVLGLCWRDGHQYVSPGKGSGHRPTWRVASAGQGQLGFPDTLCVPLVCSLEMLGDPDPSGHKLQFCPRFELKPEYR